MNNKLNNQKGFTLIELVASLVILSIILISFFSFFHQSLLFSNKNAEKISSYNIARDFLNVTTKRFDHKFHKNQLPITITCTNYNNYFSSFNDTPYERNCPYVINQNTYYPEINIEYSEFNLFLVHVKIYDSNIESTQKVLSESFQYVKECEYDEDDQDVCK